MKGSPAPDTTSPPRRKADRALSDSIEILHQIFQAVDLFSRKTLHEFGVSGPQIWALRTIAHAGVLRMGDLAQSMHLHMSTVTGIIDRLEAAKLVTRERATSDGRVMELRVTSRGRAILSKAPEPPRSKAARGLSRLSPKQLREIRSALLLIARAMDVPVLPTAPENA